MKELHQIKDLHQAKALLNPLRVAMLHLLHEPKTCLELAEALELSQQRANNNIKELLKAGLVRKIETRRKRNLIEGVYQAVGKTYWFSPQLARAKNAAQFRDQQSLHNLMRLSERLQEDASQLLSRTTGETVPSIGLTADIVLRTDREREDFAKEFLTAIHRVLEKYQGAGKKSESFTAMVACYPSPGKEPT